MNRTLILALALAGCTGEKPPVDDSFQDLAGVDEKSDKFTGKMTIVGSLDYGQTSATISHKANTWSAFKFAGDAGDQVSIDVKSTNGDTVAWLLDNDFNIVAFNDDYKGSTNSHIDAKLPANASRTHYIVTRDYNKHAMKFTVALKGTPVAFDAPCKVDADCALVRPDCCNIQNNIGVRADRVDAYRASLMCPAHLICPAIAIRNNHSTAECLANKCVAVLPADVACGGRSLNPHNCPQDWECQGPNLAVDGTGKCFQQCGGIRGLGCDDFTQTCVDDPNDSCDPAHGGADCMGTCQAPAIGGSCGGFANLPCPTGQACVENPNDSCDPAHGGADCPGMCVLADDCRATGCDSAHYCTICWNPSKWSCVPNGALC